MRRAIAAILMGLVSASAASAQPACKPGAPNCKPADKDASSKMVMDRDTQRKSDIGALKIALEAYAKKNGGKYAVAGSGSNGQGFVSVSYGGQPSVAQALTSAGFLKTKLSDRADAPDYMIYLCDDNKRYSLSATLDRASTAEIEKAQKTCNALGANGTYTTYKKNYAVGN